MTRTTLAALALGATIPAAALAGGDKPFWLHPPTYIDRSRCEMDTVPRYCIAPPRRPFLAPDSPLVILMGDSHVYTATPLPSGPGRAASIHGGGGFAGGGSAVASSQSRSDSDCGCPRDTDGNPDLNPDATPGLTPVPLPATLPLFIAALGGLAILRRRFP